MKHDGLGVEKKLSSDSGDLIYYSLEELEKHGYGNVSAFPFTIKILLEAVLRQMDGRTVTGEDLERVTGWLPHVRQRGEIAFKPARIVMQDFTGVPAMVDLAAMRDALLGLDADPELIDPEVPVDLVIDHSVQVDRNGTVRALAHNAKMEFRRNRERYEFLRWGASAFRRFRVVPPATGIVHQVNLEYLAEVVSVRGNGTGRRAFPDTLVGTDSHTTMINGLGVLGWGVGGIEAEAALLGEPISLLLPDVIGFRLSGKLPEGVTATDLVLRITELLRKYGVVGRFIEFFGPGIDSLSLPDRATISNMTPEYGATVTFFPIDAETIRYLRFTGRSGERVRVVELYAKAQGLFRTSDTPEPAFTDIIELDMGSVVPSLAGPKRPQDRIPLPMLPRVAAGGSERKTAAAAKSGTRPGGRAAIELGGNRIELCDGSVVISAITSCTNTSNPFVMVGAGLVAKKAVELGLRVPVYVKTSLAPGSKVVTRYLQRAGLLAYLEALGYHTVGYGCTTCIGNSGPLHPEISGAIHRHDLTVAAVLSGNRNFEGRIHPDVRANFLASPPLVVAYGIAGTVNIDLTTEPLGLDPNGKPVYLKDVWPADEEIEEIVRRCVTSDMFSEEYAQVFTGNATWNGVKVGGDRLYAWDSSSTYIRKPPFFSGLSRKPPPALSITGARVLAFLGDSVTTDHISPAGAIPAESPAGKWLIENGVEPDDFNTYGSRRGNHEVMMRGTFANIRIRNRLAPGREGGYTKCFIDDSIASIYDASVRYRNEGVPLIVIAGREYGTGSSRDWAAKGTALLGVKAVIAESFERIHRSNLIGMGVLPLQFRTGQNADALGLDGTELYDVPEAGGPGGEVEVTARGRDGKLFRFTADSRIDTPVELTYYRNGGILQTVLLKLAFAG
jgi:aconitate hydratase